MCAEMKINGGLIMLGDHCGPDADKTEATVTVSYEVGKDQAVPITEAFKANGGEIVQKASMQFWGQGKKIDSGRVHSSGWNHVPRRAPSDLLSGRPCHGS